MGIAVQARWANVAGSREQVHALELQVPGSTVRRPLTLRFVLVHVDCALSRGSRDSPLHSNLVVTRLWPATELWGKKKKKLLRGLHFAAPLFQHRRLPCSSLIGPPEAGLLVSKQANDCQISPMSSEEGFSSAITDWLFINSWWLLLPFIMLLVVAAFIVAFVLLLYMISPLISPKPLKLNGAHVVVSVTV